MSSSSPIVFSMQLNEADLPIIYRDDAAYAQFVPVAKAVWEVLAKTAWIAETLESARNHWHQLSPKNRSVLMGHLYEYRRKTGIDFTERARLLHVLDRSGS